MNWIKLTAKDDGSFEVQIASTGAVAKRVVTFDQPAVR